MDSSTYPDTIGSCGQTNLPVSLTPSGQSWIGSAGTGDAQASKEISTEVGGWSPLATTHRLATTSSGTGAISTQELTLVTPHPRGTPHTPGLLRRRVSISLESAMRPTLGVTASTARSQQKGDTSGVPMEVMDQYWGQGQSASPQTTYSNQLLVSQVQSHGPQHLSMCPVPIPRLAPASTNSSEAKYALDPFIVQTPHAHSADHHTPLPQTLDLVEKGSRVQVGAWEENCKGSNVDIRARSNAKGLVGSGEAGVCPRLEERVGVGVGKRGEQGVGMGEQLGLGLVNKEASTGARVVLPGSAGKGVNVPHHSLPMFGGASTTSSSESTTAIYPQVGHLRQVQRERGYFLSNLTPTQLGLVLLHKTHHVTANTTHKVGLPTYRVRVCKGCFGEGVHLELGTYVDQESAILVNDAHEILAGRFKQLLVLREEDKPFLGVLWARRFHKGKVQKIRVLESIADKEKEAADKYERSMKKRSRNATDLDIDGFQATGTGGVIKRSLSATSSGAVSISSSRVQEKRERVLNSMSALMRSKLVMGLYTTLGMAHNEKEARTHFQAMLMRTDRTPETLSSEQESSPSRNGIFSFVTDGPPICPKDELEGTNNLLAPLASSYLALLSAYAPVGVDEVVPLVQQVSELWLQEREEQSLGQYQLLEDMHDMTEDVLGGSFDTLLPVMVRVANYLRNFQGFAWNLLHEVKFPRWKFGRGGTNVEEKALLNDSHAKIIVALKMLDLLSKLDNIRVSCPRIDSILLANKLDFDLLLTQTRGSSASLAVDAASLAGRLFDSTGNCEELELGLQYLIPIEGFLLGQSQVMRLSVNLVQVSLRTASLSKRMKMGESKSKGTSKILQRIFPYVSQLLDIADEMGLLPETDNKKGTSARSLSHMAQRNEGELGVDPLKLEYTVLVFSYCLEYNVLAGLPQQWRPGLTTAIALQYFHNTVNTLLRLHEGGGMTFLFAEASRALRVVMELCRDLARDHRDCKHDVLTLSNSCHHLLRYNGERFMYSSQVAESTQDICKFFAELAYQTKTSSLGET